MSKVCLVVDDSSVVRKVCNRIIKSFGFEVMEASDGKEALEQCTAKTPDIILLDWNMPGMDGMAFLKEYKEEKAKNEVKIIFCTAENDVDNIMLAMGEGADEYIMKPFDEEILRTKFVQMGLLESEE